VGRRERYAPNGVLSRVYVENKGFNLAPQVGFEPSTLRLTEGHLALFTVATCCYKWLFINNLWAR